MSFSEGMDQCIRTSLPVLFLALTFLSLSLAKASHVLGDEVLGRQGNATETPRKFTKNELLLGSHDPFFWFLMPLFGLICVGVCIAANYVVLALTQMLTSAYSRLRSVTLRNDEGRSVSCHSNIQKCNANMAQTHLYRFRGYFTCSKSRHNWHLACYGGDHHTLPIRIHGALSRPARDLHACSKTSTRNS